MIGRLGSTWDVPEIGALRLVVPQHQDLVAVDAAWPARRRPSDLHHHWRWTKLVYKRGRPKPERCALVDRDSGLMAAVWCSGRSRPIKLADGRTYYRVDYFEIDPARTGGLLGFAAFSVIAARALSLGATAITLGVPKIAPRLLDWYLAMGGVQELAPGWNVQPDQLPVRFVEDVLVRLQEDIDGYEVEDDEAQEGR